MAYNCINKTVMYAIIVLILFVIFLELYYAIKNLDSGDLNIPTNNGSELSENIKGEDYNNKTKFNRFFVNGGKKIDHRSGKIFIDYDNNIFIHYSDKINLMKKNVVYYVPGNFILEIIDVNAEIISYYYAEDK